MDSKSNDIGLNTVDKTNSSSYNSTYLRNGVDEDSKTAALSSTNKEKENDVAGNTITPDDILHELGGCGTFQIILVAVVHTMKTTVCWSMLGNAFFAYTPRWRCADDDNITTNLTYGGAGYNTTSIGNATADKWNQQCSSVSGEACKMFEFDNGTSTWVTEFDLVCDMSWVPATIISLQMIGMCLGSFLCGQLADLLGRRGVMFTAHVLLFIFHLVSYFSTYWLLIAVARFFIGIGCSFYLATCYTIMTEFTLSKWRAVVTSVPSWAIQGSIFALVSYLLHDWKNVSLATSLLAFVTLSAWFFVPESLRWLLTHNKQDKAEILVVRISRWNKSHSTDFKHMCEAISNEESQKTVKKYSVLILFRKLSLLKITLPLAMIWLSMGLISYGINFAVQKLSGNLYMNIFLFAIASLPAKFISIYLQTRFGRKAAGNIAFGMCLLGALVVGIIQYIDTPYRDSLTNYCALAASVGVDFTWGPMQTMTLELYPTVVRNTGFGFVSIFARIGAVIGPQFVYLGEFVPGLLFFVVAVMALFSILSLATLPETRHKMMTDRIGDKITHREEAEEQL